ncbi:probable inactive ATP-dependent zinc metalloprotease FTSHI 1, chloroplastic [Cornus florida]|uniref:probable inactive ATP-dependent zinc metalloprotease FTSHI 1, chloroplastic n=1 Tax=Cornus florida TaxID=4283 RepID=UPI00289E6B38|nr:probable inactive ATP-dependent zinc metalloprotease FTSHI 1, chloroplastic [Cornus florida]
MASADIFISGSPLHPKTSIHFLSSLRSSVRLRKTSIIHLNFTPRIGIGCRFLHRPLAILRKSDSRASAVSNNGTNSTEEDFISRVLKQNPSQVEPKYLIGDKLYTLKEKQDLETSSDFGVFEFLKRLNLRKKKEQSDEVGDENRVKSDAVYLKDILREHRGKLYVPEQIFGANLSEEEEFDRDLEALPKMSLEYFRKAMRNDKIKLLMLKEETGVPYSYGFKDYIVELKDIPGDKKLQRTKWAMKLDENEARALLEEYTGPRYEIERQTTSWVGKSPEYPHPVASSISSRMMVELGMVTAVMAAAAAIVGGFLASAVFAMTSFIFATVVYVVWPMAKPFFKLFFGIVFGILERVWENFADIFGDGGIFSKLYEVYTFGGVSASLEMLKPIMAVFLTMVLLVRFTLSRRPKNFRKWDIWQGIEFSQSKPQARVDGSTGVTFNDVAGIEEAVEELQELVRYLKNPDLFDKMGIKPPHGVLLEGPPGCGKTLVAKAIAGEAGVPFYQMAGSEFVEVLVGVGSARIRDLFKRAKVNKPSVIFIDEIDALATRRQGIFSDSTDQQYNAATQEKETTLNQLLIELDGFDTGKGVIFLGATNRRDLLDPALLRPGRFDRKIRIRPPNAKGRLEILKVHARKVKLSESVDLSAYAQNLPGWTGAKLAQLLQEAALVAVRKGHKSILQMDVDDAVDRLTVGPKRVGIDLGHQGQCRRATTEVGTALTSHLLRRYENAKVERCDRISINPRGQTFSQLVFHRLDDESYMFERRPQLLHRLQVLLGGRAAEEVIFGRDTSRASVNYLADASWLARKIITIWNLENPMVIHGEPPPWRKNAKFVGPRLDFEGSLYDDYDLIEHPVNFNLDDDVAQRTEKLMQDMYGRTVALLRRHHAALLKTVKVLLNQKEINGEEIDFILNNYPPHTPTSHILEEKDLGSLPFFREKEEQGHELEYSLPTPSQGKLS